MATDVNHIQPNPDFVQEAKDRLLGQFRQSPNLNSIVEIDAERWKLIYDTLNEFATGRLLDNATGVNLDNIGASIGLLRTSADDDQYRNAIKLRAYSKNIGNDLDSMIDIIARYTGVPPEQILVYKEYFKGYEFQVATPYLTDESLTELVRLFPVLGDISFIQKDRLASLAGIAIDSGGNEIDSADPNVLGLGSSVDTDSEDLVGYLAATVYYKKLPK